MASYSELMRRREAESNQTTHRNISEYQYELDRRGLTREMATLGVERAQIQNEGLIQQQALEKQRLAQAGEFASQYLASWNTALGNATNMFNTAADAATKAMANIDSAGSYLPKLDAIAKEVGGKLTQYESQYGDLKGEAIGTAREELGARRSLTATFMDLARLDTEGAADRVGADVAQQAEMSRKEMADDLIGRGIDPASAAGRSFMEKSRSNEVLSTVGARNRARIDEKDRVGGMAGLGLQVIDPTKSAGIATDIDAGSRELMSMKGGLVKAGVDARADLAKTGATVANSISNTAGKYGETVAKPQGEFGAAMFGMQMAPRTAP